MTQVFVYEFITGGGLLSGDLWPPPESLLREGAAMAHVVISDLASCGMDVSTLVDERSLRHHRPQGCQTVSISSADAGHDAFRELARRADWTIVIAPEFDGHLCAWTQRIIDVGGRLLGSSLAALRLTSDKHRTAEHLTDNGILAPPGIELAEDQPLPASFRFPAVLKPIDGAGSQNVRLVRTADQAISRPGRMRLEEYQPGVAASIAFLCGPREIVPLVPCRQHLSNDGRFTYLGGSLPLPAPLAERATRLGLAAVRTLPGSLGYIGVDLVLGEDPQGHQDAVIEINPRLTTSYVGLRAASRANLAAGMIAIADGKKWTPAWNRGLVTFLADGETSRQCEP